MKKTMIAIVAPIALMTGASASFSKDLVVGVANFEPFFIEENERGIFVDVIKEVFKLMPQHTIKFSFMTNRRLLEDLNTGALDAAVNMLENYELNHVYLSEPVFRYRDAVIALKSKNLTINAVADLQKTSIATHQGAMDYLGAEFKALAQAHPNYKEYRVQSQICEAVAAETMDVGIEDPYVFFFDLKRLNQADTPADAFAVYPIFPEGYTLMGFKDESIRNEFNQALATLKANGTYEAVFETYKKELNLEWYKQ